MRKKFLELKFEEEMKKVENAEYYYNKVLRYNSLTITLFIMNLIIILISAIFEFLVIPTDGMLVNLIVFGFSSMSLICLCMAVFYKNKTLNILKQHYENA